MRYFLLILSVVFICVSCEKDPAASGSTNTTSTENDKAVAKEKSTVTGANAAGMTYFVTTTANLQLRAEPDPAAEVLADLDKGQLLRYLNETAGEEVEITINEKTVKGNWRKVIVTTLTESTGEMGWVFSGGVKALETVDKTLKDGHFRRSFAGMPGSEIAKIADFELPAYEGVFKGYFTFLPATKGRYLLDGPFMIRGEMAEVPKEFAGMNMYDDYQGEYLDGELHGKLFLVSKGYESVDRGYINFENGKCTEGMFEERGEGMLFKAEEKNMPECTFEYLRKKMVEVEL